MTTATITYTKIDTTGVGTKVESVEAVPHGWHHVIEVEVAAHVLAAPDAPLPGAGFTLRMSEPDIRALCDAVLERLDDPALIRPAVGYGRAT